MSLHSRWEARIYVGTALTDAGNFTLTESAPTTTAEDITISTGSYYWSGDSGQNWAAELKTQLEAASANTRTYTVTVGAGENGTGKCTIAVSSGTFAIAWGSADGKVVRDICGFTGSIGAAASATGTTAVEGLWLPGCPVETPYHLSSSGMVRSAGMVSLSEDGTYYCFHGSKFVVNEYTYVAVAQNKVIAAAEDTVGESYETFWLDAIRGEQSWAIAGSRLRFYKDVADDATFKTVNILNVTEPEYQRLTTEWDGLWTVRLNVSEYS